MICLIYSMSLNNITQRVLHLIRRLIEKKVGYMYFCEVRQPINWYCRAYKRLMPRSDTIQHLNQVLGWRITADPHIQTAYSSQTTKTCVWTESGVRTTITYVRTAYHI